MMEFMGYPRPDGSVGIRNHVVLLGVDPGGLDVCQKVSRLVKGTLAVYGGPLDTRVLSLVASHPNVAGSLVLGEWTGSEELSGLITSLEKTGKPHRVIELGGLEPTAAVSEATRCAAEIVRDVSTHRRELARLSKLLPVLFQVPAHWVARGLVSFVDRMVGEGARCIWAGAEPGAEIGASPPWKQNLARELAPGEVPGPEPGLYRSLKTGKGDSLLRTIVASGAQILLLPVPAPKPLLSGIVPGLRVAMGPPPGPPGGPDMDLREERGRRLTPEEAGLLILSEILATSSGKLTRDEILQEGVVVLGG